MVQEVRMGLLCKLQEGILQKQRAVSSFEVRGAVRKYQCQVKSCTRRGYAGGYCNTHYMRNRKGKDMDAPIRARKRDDLCTICNTKTGMKGGWGYCNNHYKQERTKILKEIVVAHLGGKCTICNNSFPLTVYDFHHKSDKVQQVSSLWLYSLTRIAREVEKCVLVCANCHRILHSIDNNRSNHADKF